MREGIDAFKVPGSPLPACASKEELDGMEPERDEVESGDDRLLVAGCTSPARVWNVFLRLRGPSKAEDRFLFIHVHCNGRQREQRRLKYSSTSLVK